MKKEHVEKVLYALDKNFYNNQTKPFIVSQCLFEWNHKRGDKTPSFGIKTTEDDYSWCKCYSCHKTLIKLEDALSILNGRKKNKYDAILEFVHEHDNPSLEKRANKALDACRKSYAKSDRSEKKDLDVLDERELSIFHKNLHPYAKTRKISNSTYSFWELMIDKKRNRLIFPIRREKDNGLIGATGRSLNGEVPKYLHYWNTKKSSFFYGEHLIRKDTKKIILVEGTIDVVKMWQFFNKDNPEYVFLATLGSSLSGLQALRIREKELPTVLMYDSDKAGRDCTEIAKHYLKKYVPLYAATLPDEYDPGHEDLTFNLAKKVIEEAEFIF